MEKIKFAKQFTKIHDQREARLKEVVKIDRDTDLTEKGVKYDSQYVEYIEGTTRYDHYPLPEGSLLKLSFEGEDNIPFTTYRNDNLKAFRYYKRNVDQVFQIDIEDEKDKD